MSRTHKDKPRRFKNKAKNANVPCNACESTRRVITREYSLTAIFYAHEHKRFEEFIALAEELGYRVTSREIEAYLGEYYLGIDNYRGYRQRFRHGDLMNLIDSSRALYSEPRGVPQRMLVNIHGANKTHGDEIPLRDINDLPPLADRVSHKLNLFRVIEVTREVSHEETKCDKHGVRHGSYNYSCGCYACSGDRSDELTHLRGEFSKMKNRFNSEGIDEIDHWSSPLV